MNRALLVDPVDRKQLNTLNDHFETGWGVMEVWEQDEGQLLFLLYKCPHCAEEEDEYDSYEAHSDDPPF